MCYYGRTGFRKDSNIHDASHLTMEEKDAGRRIASFECKASSASATYAKVVPSLLAMVGLIASQLGEQPMLIAGILIAVALVSLIAPAVYSGFASDSMCILMEGGIRLEPTKKSQGKPRVLRWEEIGRYQSKENMEGGGKIVLYPKKALSFFRRETIIVDDMSNYLLLYNHVASKVGVFAPISP